MSLRTPILMTPSVYCAKAEPLARSAAITIRLRVAFIPSSMPGRRPFVPIYTRGFATKHSPPPLPKGDHSNAEIFMQLVSMGVQFRLSKALSHAAMFHHIVAVRHRRGEMEILLNQHDRKPLRLKGPDGAADLLDDDRRQTLSRLIKQ